MRATVVSEGRYNGQVIDLPEDCLVEPETERLADRRFFRVAGNMRVHEEYPRGLPIARRGCYMCGRKQPIVLTETYVEVGESGMLEGLLALCPRCISKLAHTCGWVTPAEAGALRDQIEILREQRDAAQLGMTRLNTLLEAERDWKASASRISRAENVTVAPPENVTVAPESTTLPDEWICRGCGRVCASHAGLAAHERSCETVGSET